MQTQCKMMREQDCCWCAPLMAAACLCHHITTSLSLQQHLQHLLAVMLTQLVLGITGGPALENLRRFEIAEVRRKARNLPRGYLQADLDIVHPSALPPADKLLAEAEVIKVLCCAVLCAALCSADV